MTSKNQPLDEILQKYLEGMIIEDATGYKIPKNEIIFKHEPKAKNSIKAKSALQQYVNDRVVEELEEAHKTWRIGLVDVQDYLLARIKELRQK